MSILKELQRKLCMLGLYINAKIDGIDGPKTQAAKSEFLERENIQGDLGKALAEKIDRLPVVDYLSPDGYALAIAVKNLCTEMYHPHKEQWAYIMATVEHETNKQFYPVTEAYYLKGSQERHLRSLRYYPYYGRGLVQLTWEYNYEKYSEILGIDLVNNPDAALDSKLSLFILIHGTLTGSFTGKKLSDYINRHNVDFDNARRVVNGTDRAADISKLAEKWLEHYG